MTQLSLPLSVVAARVREVRDGMRPKLSAAGLAERCAVLGMPQLNRHVLANIESGRRESVSVDELFVLALALGVAPVHLLVPIEDTVDDDDLLMNVTPGMIARVDDVRRWVTGDEPMRSPAEPRGSTAYRDTYWREAPAGWRDRLVDAQRQYEQVLAARLGRAIERAGGAGGKVDVDELLRELVLLIGPIPDADEVL